IDDANLCTAFFPLDNALGVGIEIMARLQMRAQKQNEARIGMVRRRPVDTRPEGIAGARSRGADVGMAVMTVDSPGVKDPLVVEKLMRSEEHTSELQSRFDL